MSASSIHFFTEDINYVIKQKRLLKEWLLSVIKNENYALQELNFILCSDDYLLNLNQQYLDHDTYTDIITFDNSDIDKTIIGDIFISVERIKENAKKFGVTQITELHRVMIHGALHLLGYKDKSAADKIKMTLKEDHYLAKRSF